MGVDSKLESFLGDARIALGALSSNDRSVAGLVNRVSELRYSEWGSVFGDEFAAVTIIDRLLHYSTTVNIRGESYRLKDKRKAGQAARRTVPAA